MSKKLKKRLIRIIISLLLFIPLFIIDKVIDLKTVFPDSFGSWLFPLSLYLVIYFIISYDILIKCVKNIIRGQFFDENFLMSIATFGAFAIQEFPEAVAVMLFYQIGEFFQDLAVGKSRKSIASLMDIRPDYANLLVDGNKIEVVDPELVNINDVIRIEPGEKIPLDGVVISGSSSLDTKALTGESLPQEVTIGQNVISGTINLSSTLDVMVNKTFTESTVSKILELVENSTNVKSKQENFISKFAKWYTPIVVIAAVLLALIGSLVTRDIYTWVARSLNFLVVSCPCAIVISVPLSFFASIGKAAKVGILIKGSVYLEEFSKTKYMVFDKTGTLTKGNFVVSKIIPEDKQELILKYASICEGQSSHPIAVSIRNKYQQPIDLTYMIENVAGKGVIARKDEVNIYCGNHKLMEEHNFSYPSIEECGTVIYVAKDNEYLGAIIIEDEIKEETKEVLCALKKDNIRTIMLTGDNEKVAKHVAHAIDIDEFKHSLLPIDKVNEINNLLTNKKQNEVLCFVGDGINDAPVLARSDIGISMGGVGSDAAIEASDIVLMHDNLSSLINLNKISKKTMRIVYENIFFAIGVKLLILILSAFGLASIWLAVFGDVGVAILCVLNSLRCLGKK